MGVYDFFKGQCPMCPRQIDDHPEFGKCGDIQTKYFIEDDEACFREFFPQQRVPFAPLTNFVIGRTCCCHTIIKACFDDDVLVEYHVAVGHEKAKYIEIEMSSSFERQYIPKMDQVWYTHYRLFQQNNLEEHILQAALHPHKMSYYLDLGHSITDVCDS